MFYNHNNSAYDEAYRQLLKPEYWDAPPEVLEAITDYVFNDAPVDAEWLPLVIPLISAAVSAAPSIIQAFQGSSPPRPSRPAPRPAPPPPAIRPAPPPPRTTARPAPPPAASRPAAPPAAPRTPTSTAPQPGGVQPNQPQPDQSNAALQLLTALTVMLPQILQATGAMAMGDYGRETIRVGEQLIPVEALPHMVKSLAEQAIEQYQAARHAAFEQDFGYMRSDDGEYLADPANPDNRANAVYNALYNTMLPEETPEFEAYYDPYQEAMLSWMLEAMDYDDVWGY